MLIIIYPPVFVKKFGKLEISLQEEAFEKIELFKDRKNHKILKMISFSMNDKYL